MMYARNASLIVNREWMRALILLIIIDENLQNIMCLNQILFHKL